MKKTLIFKNSEDAAHVYEVLRKKSEEKGVTILPPMETRVTSNGRVERQQFELYLSGEKQALNSLIEENNETG